MADTLPNIASVPDVDSAPAAKRTRLDVSPEHQSTAKGIDVFGNTVQSNSPRAGLPTLPLELLAEILLHTHSPPTVLAVSRTSSYFYRTLTHPTVSFIWRGVRKTCEPIPLPEPGDAWRGSEADYAAFVFDGGICELCKKKTSAMYVSFAARVRLCGSYYCRKTFITESLIDVTSQFLGQARRLIWVPYVESTRCFSPLSIMYANWPDNNTVLLRRSDWENFRCDPRTYMATQAGSDPTEATSVDSTPVAAEGTDARAAQVEGGQVRDPFLEQCHAAIQRFPKIMNLSVKLLDWKRAYEEKHRSVKTENESWARVLAGHEGWEFPDLLDSKSYGSLHRRKTHLLENIGWDDISPIRSAIEFELLERQARRNRQKTEASYKQRLVEVQKIYERMRSGTAEGINAPGSGSSSKIVLPPLTVFFKLPSVCTLKGQPDPDAVPPENNSAMTDLKSSALAASLISSDIRTWLVPVQSYLMGLLGYSGVWRSASQLKVAPLERVTARFLCRRCGRVGRQYRRQGCLDLQGVCSHVCKRVKGKGIEEKPREMQEHGGIGGNDNDDQYSKDAGEVEKKENGGKKKKKKKEKTLDWKVEVFQKDERAIALVNVVLKLLDLSDEDLRTASQLGELGGRIRCMTCTGWIVMDFETAIGHSHRHESMQIQLLSTSNPLALAIAQPNVDLPTTSTRPRLGFDLGLAERLMAPTYRALNLRNKDSYGCKHCLAVGEGNVVGDFEEAGKGMKKKGVRAMNLNALRSHVKGKHGIQDIRDEDIFCYTLVEGEQIEEKEKDDAWSLGTPPSCWGIGTDS
ncbi:hypothetical protein PAXRUDRAFT_802840 [Paxillus rubicundulus Ve08.2h10]|uniref:F-box domain-containing protein n=1 Tax=Paxillus rubicundulus Ve08.2h10 TaxID=930991 RepID=A0A0D0CS55_9AGAM|nr:hypothetical protein PAXRUDRAFT_802840 [Paxillus rubicundulus Ve08.2h10]